MWTVELLDDPLQQQPQGGVCSVPSATDHVSYVAHAQCSLINLGSLQGANQLLEALRTSGRVASVALADYVARQLSSSASNGSTDTRVRWEPLECTTLHRRATKPNGRRRQQPRHHVHTLTPFMLERTDVAVTGNVLHVFLRVFVSTTEPSQTPTEIKGIAQEATAADLSALFAETNPTTFIAGLMTHLAVAVLQDRLRTRLSDENAVAFVANGAILPRKSGASAAPMSSPPAIPFAAPTDSPLQQTVSIDMGILHAHVAALVPQHDVTPTTPTTIQLTGLLIPRGVSLIVGGGYHGKSTLLRCLAAGVYNKIPGDGREFCVTVEDAVTVRAEDGRYVRNCNVSAFISNLPITLDTKSFSTGEASGSTSQAANVVEAMEMGASAMLVDEDVSAANFMARDGRMRSLVMDESITPLLYRVNGLFTTHGISSIVVVGGVGDWLDVPDAVILMDRYLCKDATAKARSISNQFSHGHVQYGGRGVVHRLQWENSGTPTPRRPAVEPHSRHVFDMRHTAVALLDGSDSISLEAIDTGAGHHGDTVMNGAEPDFDDDECYIDMSRCEQLMGKKPQLYGCGLCLVWLLTLAQRHPDLGMVDLLKRLDATLDEKGMLGLVLSDNVSASWTALVETLGYAYRPRRFEVGQALTRFRGLILEPLPVENDGVEEAAKAEAERRRNELLEIWNNRRRNPLEQIRQKATSSAVE